MIKTECKDCVFAVKHKRIQQGCSLGKIDTFKELGTKVEFVNNNFEIVGRICSFCRNKEWAKNEDYSVLEKRINEEVRIKHSYVIVYNNEDSLSDLFETLNSISKQTLAPYEVFVVNNSHRYIESKKIFGLLKNLFNEKSIYFVNTVFNKFNSENNYDNDYLMNLYLNKIKGNWMTVLTLPFVVNKEFSFNLNYLLNEELEKFCALIPENNLSGLTVQTFTAKTLRGNNLEVCEDSDQVLLSLIEKLKHYEKEYCTNMVRSLEELCPIN